MKLLPTTTVEKIRATMELYGVAYIDEKTGEVFSPQELKEIK